MVARTAGLRRVVSALVMAVAVAGGTAWAQAPANPAVKVTSALESADATALDIVTPGSTVVWKIAIAGAPAGAKVEWSVVDFGGQDLVKKSVPATAALTMSYKAERAGWYELALNVIDAQGKSLAQHRRAFSVSPMVKSKGEYFHFGVCAHTPSRRTGDDYTREVKLIDRLGVDLARADIGWGGLEKEPGKWNFKKSDEFRTQMTTAGVQIQSVLGYTPQWASDGNGNAKNWEEWSKAAPRVDAYVNYVKTVVSRYKDSGTYWEIWNEPDIGFWRSPTEKYTALFNAASKAIHEANPQAKVLNGGFALTTRQPNPDFLQKFLPAADQTHWDVWAYHDYMTFAQMLARYSQNQTLYKSIKATMPVWINEGGFHCLNNGGEREQALTLVKKLSTAPALGIKAYVWYDLRDDGVDPREPEHHFGLVRNDFQPKPAYTAYQSLIAHVGNAKFERDVTDLPNGTYAHVFTQNAAADQHVMVLWREGKGRSTPVWVGGVEKITGVDEMMGGAIAPVAYAGGTVVTMTDEPVYVKFSGGALTPVIKPVISTPEKVVLSGDTPSDVAVEILNPSKQMGKVTLSVEADQPKIQLTSKGETLTIAPGQSATFNTKVTAAKDAGELTGKIRVRIASTESDGKIEAEIPVTAALAIPMKKAGGPALGADEGLKLDLTSQQSIHNLFNAEPNMEMHWGGPNDLSAKAQLAYDSTGLYLNVAVEDNVHVQRLGGSDLWAADALQLAVSMSDARPDYLEAAFGLTDAGKQDGWVYSKIKGAKMPLGRIKDEIPFTVTRTGTQTLYRIKVPWAALGQSGVPKEGFRLNFIVNDDDGKGRKQWVQITPGIGEEKKPSFYKVFVCR